MNTPSHKAVPLEPTKAMIFAGELQAAKYKYGHERFGEIYKAMLEAAPAPSAEHIRKIAEKWSRWYTSEDVHYAAYKAIEAAIREAMGVKS